MRDHNFCSSTASSKAAKMFMYFFILSCTFLRRTDVVFCTEGPTNVVFVFCTLLDTLTVREISKGTLQTNKFLVNDYYVKGFCALH